MYESAQKLAAVSSDLYQEQFGATSHKQAALIWAIIFYGTMDGSRFRGKFTDIDNRVSEIAFGKYPEAFIEWRKTELGLTNPTVYLIIGEAFFEASKTAQLFADLVNIGRSPKTVIAAISSFFSASGVGRHYSLGSEDLDAYAGSMLYNFYLDGYALSEQP
jgi:hypothetical protein